MAPAVIFDDRWHEEDRGFETPCRIWTGSRDRNGYGLVSIDHQTRMAHQVAWERAGGVIPVGLEIDHRCEQRDCVNPAHLRVVTRLANVRASRATKLTVAAVRAIRAAWAEPDHPSLCELAEKHGVGKRTILHVVQRTHWAEV